MRWDAIQRTKATVTCGHNSAAPEGSNRRVRWASLCPSCSAPRCRHTKMQCSQPPTDGGRCLHCLGAPADADTLLRSLVRWAPPGDHGMPCPWAARYGNSTTLKCTLMALDAKPLQCGSFLGACSRLKRGAHRAKKAARAASAASIYPEAARGAQQELTPKLIDCWPLAAAVQNPATSPNRHRRGRGTPAQQGQNC
jgi:hypothetical protein